MMSKALDELIPMENWGTADPDGLHIIGEGWFRVWMIRRGAIPERCGMMEVKGTDMEPTLTEGCAVVVDKGRRRRNETGIFLVRNDGWRGLRRLRRPRGRGDLWTMYGDHPLCKEEKLPRRAKVVGRVMWSARDHATAIMPFSPQPERRMATRAFLVWTLRSLDCPPPVKEALIHACRTVDNETLDALMYDISRMALGRVAGKAMMAGEGQLLT